VMLQLVVPFTSIIYNCNIFIVQATEWVDFSTSVKQCPAKCYNSATEHSG
jgi:hypothetical protein